MSGITGTVVSEKLGIPCITLANKAEIIDAETLTVFRETEEAVEEYQVSLPAMVCYGNSEHEPRIPSIKGVMKANRTEIPFVSLADLGLSPQQVGPEGSPTRLSKTWRKPKKEGGIKIEGSDAEAAVARLMGYLKEQKVV